jgi:hypothetical protein
LVSPNLHKEVSAKDVGFLEKEIVEGERML